ncbi:MAG: metal ABC transporter permease [Leptospirales bacterium]|nr:metal ABC transporter permease [Leptospirales bacterium]
MTELLSYPFFTRVLTAALLISAACGITGSYIVARRIVFLSGSISHSSFGGIGIAHYFGFNPIIGAGIFAVLSAFAIEKIARSTKTRIDSVIGILWSFGMATGIIFVFITPGYAPNLISYLFGNILMVSLFDIALITVTLFIIAAVFIIFFREILCIAFDEEFALTQGIRVTAINYLMLCLTALTIVISIKAVGIILVISLLTIPQATAGLLTGDFKKMILASICFAMLSSLSGIVISSVLNIPSGAAIIFTSSLIFAAIKTAMTIFAKRN